MLEIAEASRLGLLFCHLDRSGARSWLGARLDLRLPEPGFWFSVISCSKLKHALENMFIFPGILSKS